MDLVTVALPRFLLDANLSPKIGRYLTEQFGCDVYSLIRHGRGRMPDHEVTRLARSSGRVIITLDRDFIEPYSATGQITQGVIYLDLPNSHRNIRAIQQLLHMFFETVDDAVDIEQSLVVIQVDKVIVHRD